MRNWRCKFSKFSDLSQIIAANAAARMMQGRTAAGSIIERLVLNY
jgi:hypothetical protein